VGGRRARRTGARPARALGQLVALALGVACLLRLGAPRRRVVAGTALVNAVLLTAWDQ
jgi:hypothetical protein